MSALAGTPVLHLPAAQRGDIAPAVVSRKRAGGCSLYVPLPGEEARAIRAAESFLIDFAGADFASMPWEFRPAAVKYAIGHLVTVALHSESVAEIFFAPIAAAAGITKSALRKQVEDRCWFYTNWPRLHADKRTRQEAVSEFERICA